ncbi:hypothetical protein ACP70R_008814 [Stipagrostis hirtigluma subsp. patula]
MKWYVDEHNLHLAKGLRNAQEMETSLSHEAASKL